MRRSGETTGIAGAGPVGQVLGRTLRESGEPVVAVASRTRKRAEQAAAFIGGVVASGYREIPSLASRVIIAVSDRAIEEVASELAEGGMTGGAALHTCGSRGPEALARLSAAGVSCGALHPLQTFPASGQRVDSLKGVAFGLTADGAAKKWALSMVALLDGRPLVIDAGKRALYHAAAAMASNQLVALLDAAALLMERAGVQRSDALSALRPLAETTIVNLATTGTAEALTGPVVRGDVETVAAHLHALSTETAAVSDLYKAASRRLLQLAATRGLPDVTRRALERVLEGMAEGPTETVR